MPGLLRTYSYTHDSNGNTSTLRPRVILEEVVRQELTLLSGVKIGALAGSICLAPGESREVTVTESRYSESVSSESRKESLSRTTHRRANVKTHLRNELDRMDKARRIRKLRGSMSGEGEFKYGPWGAKARSSFSGETTKDASWREAKKSLDDRVTDALDEVSTQNEVHIESKMTTKETAQRESVTTTRISNPNQGVSVTYEFWQLVETWRIDTVVEDVRILVEYDEDVIPGTGIRRVAEVSVQEVDDLFPELQQEARLSAVQTVRAAIQERYGLDDTEETSGPELWGQIQDLEKPPTFRRVQTGALFVDSSQLGAAITARVGWRMLAARRRACPGRESTACATGCGVSMPRWFSVPRGSSGARRRPLIRPPRSYPAIGMPRPLQTPWFGRCRTDATR